MDVTYDADGNMTSAYLDCTGELFRYDSTNRLVGTNTNAYTYNAENVRIRNLCGESETTYVYNTNAKLSSMLMKTTDGVVTKYVYGRGLIGEETNGVFKTYHFDYRGSTVAITDVSGNITDTFEYDTYGKLTGRTGSSDIIFLYNGRDGVVTDGNGLIYMRARYYAPELRRFINADILAGDIANGITLNRYAYAHGNPVSLIDPRGLSAERGNNFIETMANSNGDSWFEDRGKGLLEANSNYSNSYIPIYDENGNIKYYRVSSKIRVNGEEYTVHYTINTGGAIAFDFDANQEYDELLSAGGNEYLAEAMYTQAKEIDKDALDGRTIDGIAYELELHYNWRVLPRFDVANIGSTDKNNAGYDDNAWISESMVKKNKIYPLFI